MNLRLAESCTSSASSTPSWSERSSIWRPSLASSSENSSTDSAREGSDDSAPPRPGIFARPERRQLLRLQAGDLREMLAQPVEPHHLRLQLAEPHRHRVEVPLDELLRLQRFLPLIGEHDRLEPRMLDRRGVPQRDEIEDAGEGDEDDREPEACRSSSGASPA